jgi:hypothetical protein
MLPVRADASTPGGHVLTIDCSECVLAATSACDDCLVSFIVDRRPGEAVVIEADEARAVRLLGEAGLVGPLRHRARRPLEAQR